MKTFLSMAAAAVCMISFAAEAYKDLPAELKSVPANQMVNLGSKNLTSYINGKIAKDADSSVDKSAIWNPKDQTKHKLPVGLGVYDRPTKKSSGYLAVKQAPADEKYHWYKLGKVTLGADSILYVADWHIGFQMKELFVKDGKNDYEVWVSMKLQGPAYVKDSKKANNIAVDRAVFVKK